MSLNFLDITTLYACILGVMLVVFAGRVIALRRDGGKDKDRLARAIRGHANFTENVPVFLILLLLAELGGASPAILHVIAIIFVVGRLLHGVLFCFMPQPHILMRVGGMVLTFTGLIGMIVLNAMNLF